MSERPLDFVAVPAFEAFAGRLALRGWALLGLFAAWKLSPWG